MRENKIFDLLENTGLNWTVNKIALQTADEKKTESFGIFRNDNNRWLGTVGKQYTPFQNFQLAETLIDASNNIDLVFERGGALRNGGRVYLQAELPQDYIGNSGIKRFITAVNSHDGSASIGFGSSNTVIVCNNTFYMAYREIQKFKHTTTAQQRIEYAIADMRKAMNLDNKLMEKFKRMADAPLKEEIFAKIFQSCFDVDLNKNMSEYSTRKLNQLAEVEKAIQTEIKTQGKTLWGLFNGITRYTNHVAPSAAEKEDYVMSGTGYRTNLTAFNDIMQWIEKNSHEYAFVEN